MRGGSGKKYALKLPSSSLIATGEENRERGHQTTKFPFFPRKKEKNTQEKKNPEEDD